MRAIILVGPPASGKTHWSKEFCEHNPNYARINRDDIRSMLFDNVYTSTYEMLVQKAQKLLVEQAITDGYSVIIDNTHLKDDDTIRWCAFFDVLGAKLDRKVEVEVDTRFCEVPLETCLERNAKREEKYRVPERTLKEMHSKAKSLV